MLLTDKEIEALADVSRDPSGGVWPHNFAKAVQAAILEKLASAELPEPALPTHAKGPMFTADQLRQAYAQGAAAQLAEKPSGYISQYNLEMLQQGYPQTIVMLKGAKRDVPLYTRRQA